MTQTISDTFVADMNRAVVNTAPADTPYTIQPTARGLVATGKNSTMTVAWEQPGDSGLAVATFQTVNTGVEFAVSFDPSGDEKDSVVRMCFDAFKRL
ncbi:hypothetical protein ACN4D5_09805 [Corynebacterium macclintockiae]|uniref:hypothetical protein n=1 Tax=Corynebacterium macclintockiae TaxID=2913501 RepID=UPI003EBB5759